jgi:Bacterial mobilisation protein (MobC)
MRQRAPLDPFRAKRAAMIDTPEPEADRAQATDVPAIIYLPDSRRGEPKQKPVRRRVPDPRCAWLPPTRVSPGLRDKVIAEAAAAGLSLGAFIRARLDGSPGPRAKRNPGPDTVLLARVLAELGKSGSNLNQIAHRLNMDEAAELPELSDALREQRIVVAALMHLLGV